jgi:hypothetical protein
MGDVHKFRPPPKNRQQFRGYRPGAPNGVPGGVTGKRQWPGWLRAVLAWSALLLLAVAIWGVKTLLGAG